MRPYDKKYLIRLLFIIAGMFVACKFTQGAAIGIALPCMFMAMSRKKAESLFFWTMFLVISVMINAFFIPKGSAYAILQRGILVLFGGISFVQLAGQKKNSVVASIACIFLYIAYMFIPSATGWWPMVSYMKLVLFTFIFSALIGMTNIVVQQNKSDFRKIRSVFLSFAILFVFGSILLIPFPGISQLTGEEYQEAIRNGVAMVSLFKGMTVQSQALGPLMAMIGVLLLADLLFGIKKKDNLYICLLICVPYLIYKTSSRTAMGAFILASGVLMYVFMLAKGINNRWRGKVFSTAMLVMVVGVAGVLFTPAVRDGVIKYVLKYDMDARSEDVSVESVVRTRQGLMDVAMEDFKRKPLIGNGFQVDERLVRSYGGAKGLMLSAPVEKGVWITAVLQEGGVFGFLIYVSALISILVKMSRSKYYVSFTLLILFHLLNLGEFTLFSLSGLGGSLWLLVFMGIVMDSGRLKAMKNGYLMSGRYPFNRLPNNYNPMWR